jgi:hypothetical protein
MCGHDTDDVLRGNREREDEEAREGEVVMQTPRPLSMHSRRSRWSKEAYTRPGALTVGRL